MEKYRNIEHLLLILLILISGGCYFVPDPIDPRLPKYTESGNNAAGAYVNNEVWVEAKYSTYVNREGAWVPIPDSLVYREIPTLNTIGTNDSLIFIFDGKISNDRTLLEFRLSGIPVKTYSDLALLKDQKIILDGKTNMGGYIRKDSTLEIIKDKMQGGVGQFYIRNVTIVDSIKTATLSGTFGFTATNSGKQSVEISYGRFDFTFRENVNFSIK
jgi:hypothetical protein